jgi:hypothetical protein
VILQETSNKSVIQAEKSQGIESAITSNNAIAHLNSRVFPNPVSDKLIISIESVNPINYEIINSTGLMIQSGVFNQSTEISMQQYARGIYFLKLRVESIESIEKIILQ